jgi:ABC-2 type transport system permease protein
MTAVRAIAGTQRAAMAEAWANRRGFWTQVIVMVVNDVAWIAFWILFFHRVGAIRGWDSGKVMLLLAVLTTSAGFVLGVLGNARRIGRLAVEGDLDAALALPVPPLAYLLVRRIDTTNLGDLAFGIVLFAVAGHPTPLRALVFVAGVVVAATILTGFLVAAGSIAFFAGRNEAGELGFHAMLMFAAYPVDVFSGAAKALLYTVVPAAFVSAVPARLIDHFDGRLAATIVAVAAFFAFLGWALFTAGLRRYTSGAVWTRA